MKTNAIGLALLLAAAPGCHRTRDRAPAASAKVADGERKIRHHGQGAEEAGLSGPAEDDEDGGGGGGGGNGSNSGGGGGARYKDPMIYVDGEVRASFAYNEMPAPVKVYERHYDDDGVTHRMLMCDYFHWLGADCSTIKETHWYQGKGRIAIITGKELRRFKDTLYINFTKEFSGKPRVEWQSTTGLHTNERPDLVADLAIYVDKKAPKWSDKYWALVDDKGYPIDGIPYAHADGKRGVRVNLDGILKARIKRNLLDGNVTAVNADKPNEDPRYRLLDFLASQNVKVDGVRGIDLVVRQERVVRVPAAEAAKIEFVAARQHHGEMMFYFGQHYVPALAVDIWSSSEPPARPMRTVTLGNATADRGAQPQAIAPQVQGRR